MVKRGKIAISQIILLVLNIIAISWIMGSEFNLISSQLMTNEEYYDYLESLGESPSTPAITSEPTHGNYGKFMQKYLHIPTQSGTIGYSVSGILQAAGWGLLIYGSVKMVGDFLGLESGQSNSLGMAAGIGWFTGKGALAVFGKGGYLSNFWTTTLGFQNPLAAGWLGATGIGLGVAVITFIVTYKDTKTKTVKFTCEPWAAETGGKHCEECNDQNLPCSEYQCRSLGQTCQLLNQGTSDEACVDINPKDVDYPIITPNDNVLSEGYKYTPDNQISPPDRGVYIKNTDNLNECVKAFERFTFGIKLNEPAKCRADYVRKDSYEAMTNSFGEPFYKYNQTQTMSLPGVDNFGEENITLENGGNFELYVKCQDANGNYNLADFVFKFCVDPSPDTTAPLIATTSLLNDMPIAYNQSSVDLNVYINEPAECKWDHQDKEYDEMVNDLTCSLKLVEMNAQDLYKCSTILTGLKNNVENDFYFRCKDQPLATEGRNVNTESYKFTLIGTQPLVIDSVTPNDTTIKDATESVKVTLNARTSAGYKEGEAICYFSEDEENYVMFSETASYKHSQDLWLAQGEYEYSIRCIDLGGNADTKKITFNVESDNSAPMIVRAYNDEPYLKIITSEEAECVYDTTDCSYLFDDGTSMTTSDGFEHFTDWNTKINLYIKCRDEYGNSPQPSNTCSMEIRAF